MLVVVVVAQRSLDFIPYLFAHKIISKMKKLQLLSYSVLFAALFISAVVLNGSLIKIRKCPNHFPPSILFFFKKKKKKKILQREYYTFTRDLLACTILHIVI